MVENMIKYINKRLEDTIVPGREDSGIKLSKYGEEEVIKRWNKSAKNGGYSQEERDYVNRQD